MKTAESIETVHTHTHTHVMFTEYVWLFVVSTMQWRKSRMRESNV